MTTPLAIVAAGRPQDDELTEKILAEAFRTLCRDGYAAVRIEQIAASVKCGKAAIYRRWPGKAELCAAALLREARLGEVADTGDVLQDLKLHVLQNEENYSTSKEVHTDRSAWAAITEPEILKLVWDGFLVLRRAQGMKILDRAVVKGELPANADKELILDVLAGLTMYRHLIRPNPVGPGEYQQVIYSLMSAPPLRVD